MKTTVNKSDFLEAFKAVRPDNFSREGLSALFDYLEDYEAQTGEEIELDVIALCCDFTEYETLEAFQADYGTDYESVDDICDRTLVIGIPLSEGFIIQNF